MMLKRGLWHFVFAAMLLAGQYIALTHHLRHAQDRFAGQYQQQNDGKKSAHQGLCDFHVAFSQILGAVDCAKSPPRLAAIRAQSRDDLFATTCPAELLVPASRGPPAFS